MVGPLPALATDRPHSITFATAFGGGRLIVLSLSPNGGIINSSCYPAPCNVAVGPTVEGA